MDQLGTGDGRLDWYQHDGSESEEVAGTFVKGVAQGQAELNFFPPGDTLTEVPCMTLEGPLTNGLIDGEATVTAYPEGSRSYTAIWSKGLFQRGESGYLPDASTSHGFAGVPYPGQQAANVAQNMPAPAPASPVQPAAATTPATSDPSGTIILNWKRDDETDPLSHYVFLHAYANVDDGKGDTIYAAATCDDGYPDQIGESLESSDGPILNIDFMAGINNIIERQFGTEYMIDGSPVQIGELVKGDADYDLSYSEIYQVQHFVVELELANDTPVVELDPPGVLHSLIDACWTQKQAQMQN